MNEPVCRVAKHKSALQRASEWYPLAHNTPSLFWIDLVAMEDRPGTRVED